MLKSFSESIYKQLVNVKPGHVIYGPEQRDELLYYAKRIRAKDYIVNFDMDDGQVHTRTLTTTANWFFVLTGAAVVCDQGGDTAPRVGIKFQNFYPTSPFGTVPEDFNDVNFELVFGNEGKDRFEEYKNIWYVLGQRVTVNIEAIHRASVPQRLGVILTGIEMNLQEEVE